MNRHARYALLAPLLVTAVAVPPTMAAQAAPAGAAPLKAAAAPQATCRLVVAPGTNPVEFDLVMTGFRGGQLLRVTGPESFQRNANGAGSVTEENVKNGSYTVKSGWGRNELTTGCSKPPRPPAKPRITSAEITGASTTPAAVDCTKPQNVTFQGKFAGTGTGEIDYHWAGQGKQIAPSVQFTAPETATAPFVVKSPTRAAVTEPVPKVTVQLFTGNVSDSFTFTLTCAPGT
ncbi:hypothetical protein ACFY7H_26110 [Streptomyces sp. NPDC012794]|uniref:hypothetical protein n=1 Tax=Streptomyces sp. NPDC012794 TaxID=3364850 RepID=UPI0036C7768B